VPAVLVREGVHRLGSSWVNWYLVEDGGLTVVDCGYPGYHDQLGEALAEIGREPGDVDAVVLTHYHVDHVGSAERIRRETGATVYAPAGDAPGIRGDAKVPLPGGFAANLWRPRMMRYLAHALQNGGARPKPVAEVTTYEDGQVLDVPGGLRAIHMPGHTGGQCALVYPGRGILFAGDALGTMSVVSGRLGPQLPPVGEDLAQARESLARLEGVEADLMLCGHGEPFEGTVAEALERARRDE
jgi:glyoxylase-like metal-dependent hydrolase (beta-lactamase superfamily II)